eukprot:TRINITY_DN4447_c0_g4_i1.p1 TRINITY_DN4447_c0_g4~~TRINITY_DN4447_c0_g4_i1.p1  ORF type:complete len:534 (+),score=136.35 TRINITY_DN4447_c0_g4_i1:83-1684(+)
MEIEETTQPEHEVEEHQEHHEHHHHEHQHHEHHEHHEHQHHEHHEHGKDDKGKEIESEEEKTFKNEERPSNGRSIIFFNVPLHGHVNPTLDLVDELVKRGYNIVYYASDNFKDKIEGIGATFRGYEDVYNFTLIRDISNIFHTAREMLEAAEKIMDLLVPRLTKEKYDLIMYDVSAVWGKFIGEIIHVPSVCCFPGLAPQWKGYVKSKTLISRGIQDGMEGFKDMQESRTIRDRITEKFKLTKISSSKLFAGSKVLNIVFTSPYLQPYGNDMTDKFLFIGPTLKARKETVVFPFEDLNPKFALVYISMGTLYRPDITFFKTCIAAFKEKPFNVIISIGKAIQTADLEPIPDNIHIKSYVPQLDVLERTRVFISHGGMGGVNEAMFYNVPMLILPKTIEQQVNALRIEELGAGVDLHTQDVTPEQLLAGVEKILADHKYVEATKVISKSFKETGGIVPAAGIIDRLVGEGEAIDAKTLKKYQTHKPPKNEVKPNQVTRKKSLKETLGFGVKPKGKSLNDNPDSEPHDHEAKEEL